MMVTVGIGRLIENKRSVAQVLVATLISAVIFYIATNFAVWAWGALYPRSGSGLIACYTAAIPFFRNSLIGDIAFVAVLFGGFDVLEDFLFGYGNRCQH